MTSTGAGFPWVMYWSVVLGILISVGLPILRRLIPKAPAAGRVVEDPPAWQRILGVGAFSLLTAVIILAISKNQVDHWVWQDALLAGFAWDSLLQKVANG